MNYFQIMALWGSDIVALAEEAAEYERLIASAAAVQRQFIEMETDIERYVHARATPNARAPRDTDANFCRLPREARSGFP